MQSGEKGQPESEEIESEREKKRVEYLPTETSLKGDE
jgi:hypothetical protein